MRKVTVSRMRERYAQTVLTFRITYVEAKHNFSSRFSVLRVTQTDVSTVQNFFFFSAYVFTYSAVLKVQTFGVYCQPLNYFKDLRNNLNITV